MATYRSKPQEVEAIVWTGTNHDELLEWMTDMANGAHVVDDVDVTFATEWDMGPVCRFYVAKSRSQATIGPGDAIIFETDRSGFYPCEASVFAERYTALV